MPLISCRRGRTGGRPAFVPCGNSGPNIAHCSSARSPGAMNRDHFIAPGLRQRQHGNRPRTHTRQPAAFERAGKLLPRTSGALARVRQASKDEERRAGIPQFRIQAGVAVAVLLGDVRELRELPQRRPRNDHASPVSQGQGYRCWVSRDGRQDCLRMARSCKRTPLTAWHGDFRRTRSRHRPGVHLTGPSSGRYCGRLPCPLRSRLSRRTVPASCPSLREGNARVRARRSAARMGGAGCACSCIVPERRS